MCLLKIFIGAVCLLEIDIGAVCLLEIDIGAVPARNRHRCCVLLEIDIVLCAC